MQRSKRISSDPLKWRFLCLFKSRWTQMHFANGCFDLATGEFSHSLPLRVWSNSSAMRVALSLVRVLCSCMFHVRKGGSSKTTFINLIKAAQARSPELHFFALAVICSCHVRCKFTARCCVFMLVLQAHYPLTANHCENLHNRLFKAWKIDCATMIVSNSRRVK